jgi:hypothetical protein
LLKDGCRYLRDVCVMFADVYLGGSDLCARFHAFVLNKNVTFLTRKNSQTACFCDVKASLNGFPFAQFVMLVAHY